MLQKILGKKEERPLVLNDNIPQHIAIIMDGNGRWAKKRALPRVAGHKEGMKTVKKITMAAKNMGVKVLTLYAFSTENWKRPQEEVSFLMQLPIDFFDTFVPDLMKNNVRVETIGDITALPEKTQVAVKAAKEKTQNNNGMILNFALNYGSRAEMITATQTLAQAVQDGELQAADIDEAHFSAALETAFLGNLADPDLLIRTSGEERLSNFLLWQSAYSEFYFTEQLWPDFDAQALKEAIAAYQSRNRRFGGLKEEN